jgi:hypothetical protein
MFEHGRYEHRPLSTGCGRFLDISDIEKKKASQAQREIFQTKWWINVTAMTLESQGVYGDR